MCGIGGIIAGISREDREAKVSKMMDKIHHRGPDDEGIFSHDQVSLGFVRLSILDLSQAGHQPYVHESGRYVLVFNGEIYNYLELRDELRVLGHSFRSNSDTEVLLAAFIEWGKNCLNKLNGMFAFVVYDREKRSLFGARDRFGIKPFYYNLQGAQLAFCSEIKGLFELAAIDVSPDKRVVFDYLAFNRTDQNDQTFYQSIKKLKHGHFFVFENGNFKVERWYDLSERIGSQDLHPEEYKDLLKDSLKLRLRSDVPIGVCLSGGLDSTSIAGLLVKEMGLDSLNTFSAVYGEGVRGDESKYITLMSNAIDNMHYTRPDQKTFQFELDEFLSIHDEPISTTSPFAQYQVMKLAGGHVKVTLDGQGADEGLAGYHYIFGFHFKGLLTQMKWGELLSEIASYSSKHRSTYALKSMLFSLMPESLKSWSRTGQKGFLEEGFAREYSSQSQSASNLYNAKDLRSVLVNHYESKLEHLLKWEDANSMSQSIEARTPFLDYNLVEATLALPTNKVIRKGETKWILREAMDGVVPDSIRWRRDKMGFMTPETEWLRSSWFKNRFEQSIRSSIEMAEFISTDKAQAMYNKFSAGDLSLSKDIWKVYNLSYWLSRV